MNVTTERIADSQVVLTIEVDPERIEKSMDQAYRRVLPRVRVPGFRPGKAPRRVLERHVGREALLHEALDRLVPEVLEEAIKEQELDLVEQPQLEVTSLDPVVIKATVPVRPEVDLGSYRELRLEQEPVTVDEAEVEKEIEELRRRYADIEPVDRPIEDGDQVRININGEVDGQRVLMDDDGEVNVLSDAIPQMPGLYEHLLGMSKGDTAEFDVEIPEDYFRADLVGKTLHYNVEILDVKSAVLPEANDDFARQAGEGFESMAALRERVTSDVRERAEAQVQRKLEEQAVEALIGSATLEIPPQLVDRDIENMIREITQPLGGDRRAMERYLEAIGRAEQEVRDEMRATATDRVKRSLVLGRFAEIEGIEVSEDDINRELDALGGGSTTGRLREIFDTPTGRELLGRQARNRLMMERLRAIATGQAPPLPDKTTEAPVPTEAEGETSVTAGAGEDISAPAAAEPEAGKQPAAAGTTEAPESAGQSASG